MELTVVDILVFVLTILVTFSIGVVFALRRKIRRRTDLEYYFVAGRKSKMLPVVLSFVVTFQSSILLLGYPAEVYAYGLMIVYNIVPVCLAFVFTAFIIVPVFYPLKLTTVYQYFELRYGNNHLRYLTMAFGMFTAIVVMSAVTFATCVALKAVLDIPIWVIIIAYTTVTAIYKSVGGIKAVIWTDVFQSAVMFAGIIAILTKGTIESGGIDNVLTFARSRIVLDNIKIEANVRYSVWNICLGGFPYWLCFAYTQHAMQRVYTTSSVKAARNMYLVSAPIYIVIVLIVCGEGVVAFAYYASRGCDVLAADVIENINAIIPFIVVDLFEKHPGLSGLFIASLSSAALSTLSSCLNSLSAVTYIDIIKVRYPNLSEEAATRISMILVLVYGVIAMSVTLLISVLPGTVMAVFRTVTASFDGPTCAVFLMSAFCRRSTTKGLFIGALFGMAFPIWVNLGRAFSDIPIDPYLSSGPTENCFNFKNSSLSSSVYLQSANNATNNTSDFLFGDVDTFVEYTGLNHLYKLSYMWLSLCGFVISVAVGLLVSRFTQPPNVFDERCLFSLQKHIVDELFRDRGNSLEMEMQTTEEVEFLSGKLSDNE